MKEIIRKNNFREYRRRKPVLSINHQALSFSEFDEQDEQAWRKSWEW